MQPSVEYLGHCISAAGLHQTEEKVCTIVDAPVPKDVTQLRSFQGLLNYYGKFLPQLSSTLAPLYALLQKKSKPDGLGEQLSAENLDIFPLPL